MYAIANCSVVFVCEQFAVAKKGIEKGNDAGDAEALANVDEAVVLEGDGVRDSTAAPSRSPLTSPCVCVFAEQADLASPRSGEGAIGAHRPAGGEGRSGGRAGQRE